MSYEPPDRPGAEPASPLGPAGPGPAGFPYQRRFRPRFQDKTWKHVVLFLLTVCTTTLVGATYYLSFASESGTRPVAFQLSTLLQGLWYSLPVLTILGAHEMGHYLYCRRYNVDASLPYFIPAPILLTGTLGAVIRIREAFPTRTVLFDIGIAGPIAGFVALVPFLVWGTAMSRVVPTVPIENGFAFGEPLLFQMVSWLIFGPLAEGQSLNAHPMVFAAWFGMLATAFNLLPFGQMDGGHIIHASLQRYSTLISALTVIGTATMCFVSSSWIATTVVMVAMLFLVGPRHPRVLDENEPLRPGRLALAVVALVMLILCFTPVPIQVLGP